MVHGTVMTGLTRYHGPWNGFTVTDMVMVVVGAWQLAVGRQRGVDAKSYDAKLYQYIKL